MANTNVQRPNLVGLIIATGLLAWGAHLTSPFSLYGDPQPLPIVFAGLAAYFALHSLIGLLLLLARLLDWAASYQPTGKDGTASWATAKDLRREGSSKRLGPFWGRLAMGRKLPLFIDFVSNALCVAPAGSGKGIYTVVTAILSIHASKVIADFKGELICMLKEILERRGEIIRLLNPSGLWADRIGPSDSLNPLDLVVSDLHRPGGLRDVPDDLRELNAKLLPEPENSEDNNSYFREGSRRCIALATIFEVIDKERDATLASVALLIENRQRLEQKLRRVVGVDLEDKPLPDGPMSITALSWAAQHDTEDVAAFNELVQAQAINLLALMSGQDSRTFNSFISGAQQALAPFAFGRLARVMGRSSFSLNELKEGRKPTSLFIVADASRAEADKPWLGLMQWCVMTAMKRHEQKRRPVYFILDEATNYIIHGLISLLTWGRSYGLRLLIIFQDFSAFERVYGKAALETLLSETEIKQFLPGQRSPKTLELIAKMLGQQSVMSANLSQHEHGLQEQVSESGRVLMTPDEVRRTPYGLLIVRKAPPALIEPLSYAEVHPWRKQVGINPFHGKRFLKRIKLRL